VYTDVIISSMQQVLPNWHIFVISTPKEPRNADVIVRTFLTHGFGGYGIEALSAYTKEILYHEERTSFMGANMWKKMGQLVKDGFYPGSELHAKVMAQRAEHLKRQEAAKPVAAGLSKAEMQSMVTEAVASAQVKPIAKPGSSWTSDVDRPGFQLPERPADFAIIMGIEKYSDLPDAQFGERDVEAVKSHLLAMGFPSRNIVALTGGKAGFTALQKFVEAWLPKVVTPESRVFFYFSGHGAPDPASGASYLVPWDGDPSFLENTAYPVKRLYEKLSSLKAKEVIVALDACFSGAGGRSVLAKGARPLVLKVETAAVPQNLTVFAASSGEQITSTLEDQGHGTFTYYFLKGLSGGAKDASGRVTTQALYDYLKPKVQDAARRQNRDQEPVLHAQGDKELVRF
ncbi:MAG: caspase family protein, partial [Elusimicrobiota bacterium]